MGQYDVADDVTESFSLTDVSENLFLKTVALLAGKETLDKLVNKV